MKYHRCIVNLLEENNKLSSILLIVTKTCTQHCGDVWFVGQSQCGPVCCVLPPGLIHMTLLQLSYQQESSQVYRPVFAQINAIVLLICWALILILSHTNDSISTVNTPQGGGFIVLAPARAAGQMLGWRDTHEVHGACRNGPRKILREFQRLTGSASLS